MLTKLTSFLILPLTSTITDLFVKPWLTAISSTWTTISDASVGLLFSGWSWTFSDLIPLFAIACAAAVPYMANPVHSLLSLIFCFLAVSIILIASGAEFLGYLFLIVYVGAIAILFLFVIMLLNVRQLTANTRTSLYQPSNFFSGVLTVVAGCCTLKFLLELFSAVSGVIKNPVAVDSRLLPSEINYRGSDILAFAELLYTQHAALFMLATLLLLSAMIGAIVLAANSSEQS